MFESLNACERKVATSPVTATPNPDLDLPELPATHESAVYSTRKLLFNLGIYDREMAGLQRFRTPLMEATSYFIRDFRSYRRSVLERSGRILGSWEDIAQMQVDVSERASKIPILILSIEPINRRTQTVRSQLVRLEECAYAFKSRLASLGTIDPECSRLLGYIFETSRNMDEMSHPLKALDKTMSELVALEPELVIDIRSTEERLKRAYRTPERSLQQLHHSVALLEEIRKLASSYPPSRASGRVVSWHGSDDWLDWLASINGI